MNSTTPINLQKVSYLRNNQPQSLSVPNVAEQSSGDAYVPSFRGYEKTISKKGLIAGLSSLAALLTVIFAKNNIKTEEAREIPASDENIEKTGTIGEPVSDIDNMGITGLSCVKICQQPNPSLREGGYVGFMYKGKPHVVEFWANYKAEVKVAVLNKLREIDSEHKDYYNNKILNIVGNIEKNYSKIPLSDGMIEDLSDLYGKGDSYLDDDAFAERVVSLGYPMPDIPGHRPNLANIKVIQTANPSRKGYAVFMYCGHPLTASFTENTEESVRNSVYERINSYEKFYSNFKHN